jgi:tetratricopeptide (TPR) repeat protein
LEALAIQAVGRGNFGGAVRLARDALAYDPALPEANCSLARALMWQRQYEDAEPVFVRAEELDVRKPWAMTLHAVSLSKWGRHDRADVLFRKVLRAAPRWVYGWQEYGCALAREGASDPDKLRRAVAVLERAIDLDPDDADGYYLLGRVLENVDSFRAAVLARRALQMEPEHQSAGALLERLATGRADSD